MRMPSSTSDAMGFLPNTANHKFNPLDCPHCGANPRNRCFDLLGGLETERQTDGIITCSIGKAACSGKKRCTFSFCGFEQRRGTYTSRQSAPDEKAAFGSHCGYLCWKLSRNSIKH